MLKFLRPGLLPPGCWPTGSGGAAQLWWPVCGWWASWRGVLSSSHRTHGAGLPASYQTSSRSHLSECYTEWEARFLMYEAVAGIGLGESCDFLYKTDGSSCRQEGPHS